MGLFWTGYETTFSQLKLNWDSEDMHSDFYNQWGAEVFRIKCTKIDQILSPIEYGWEFLDDSIQKEILPFFMHCLFFYLEEELVADDLGFLEKEGDLYERSYSCDRMKRLLLEFDSFVDLEEIRRAYFLSRALTEERVVPDFCTHEEYIGYTYECFDVFKKELNGIVGTYRKCVAENKDLIIDFG